MWMRAATLADGRVVHAYKHTRTRRYVDLDTAGHAYTLRAGASSTLPAPPPPSPPSTSTPGGHGHGADHPGHEVCSVSPQTSRPAGSGALPDAGARPACEVGGSSSEDGEPVGENPVDRSPPSGDAVDNGNDQEGGDTGGRCVGGGLATTDPGATVIVHALIMVRRNPLRPLAAGRLGRSAGLVSTGPTVRLVFRWRPWWGRHPTVTLRRTRRRPEQLARRTPPSSAATAVPAPASVTAAALAFSSHGDGSTEDHRDDGDGDQHRRLTTGAGHDNDQGGHQDDRRHPPPPAPRHDRPERGPPALAHTVTG